MQDGLHRMYGTDDSLTDDQRNVIYYLTVYNEPMVQPAEPENVDREGILRGHLPLRRGLDRGPAGDGAARAAARVGCRDAVGARGAGAARATTGTSSPTCGP